MARKKKKKHQGKRFIKFVGTDVEIEIAKVTAVRTQKKMIHLDELPDGTWRLIYNELQIPDFTKVEYMDIIREK